MIKSIGPIQKEQWAQVSQKLNDTGKTWWDGVSFLDYNPFERFPTLKDKQISIYNDGRGLSFYPSGVAEISVEQFLKRI